MAQLPHQFVIYGDSRTLSSTASGQFSTTITGYSGWVEAFSDHAFELAPRGNFAINGATNPEWATLFANYASSEAPIAILLLGLNSQAYADVYPPFEARKAQIASMLDDLGEAGKQVILITEVPRTASFAEHYAMHLWLNDPNGALLNRPWITPVDVWDQLADPANPYLPNPEYFYDGVHLTAAGNAVLGKAIADTMLAAFPDAEDRINLPTSNADLYSAANPQGVLIANPMLEGTGGKLGAGITGALAAGWNLNLSAGAAGVTVQTSKDVSDSGFTEQVISRSGTPTGNGATLTLSISVPIANFQIGDLMRAAAMIETDIGLKGVVSVSPVLFTQNVDGTVSMVKGMIAGVPGYNLPTEDGLRLTFATPELEVLQAAKSAQFQVVISLTPGASVDGTIRVSQTSVRDYSYLGGSVLNHAPDAIDDTGLSTAVGTPLSIAISDLVANDTDRDGHTLTIPNVSGAVNGTVSRAGGNILFTPAAGFRGVASFTYTVSDGHGLIDTAKVSINVGTVPSNIAPDAVNDGVYAVQHNTALQLATAQLLANDIDGNGDALTVTGVAAGTGGTVVLSGGQVTFTPGVGHSGAASFSYTVSDGQGGTDTALVTLSVAPAAASGLPQYVGTSGNDSPAIARVATEMLGLAGTDNLRGSTFSDVLIGGSGDDHLTGGLGADQFRFLGTDIEGASDYDRLYDLNFGEGDTLLLAGFGAGKFEAASGLAVTPEGAVTIQSWAGLVNLAQDGSVIVRRLGQTTALEIIVANETGQQQTLFVKDGWAAYSAALAALPNIVPDAVNDGVYTVQHNTALQLATAQLLANDTDGNGDALTITGVGAGTGGTVALSGGQVMFTPAAGYSGAASFSYTVSDGKGGTDTALVTLNVAAGGLPQYVGTSGNDSPAIARVATEMFGLAGTDNLRGSTFSDVLIGGSGDDHLTGGLGADQFRFLGTDIEGASDYDRLYDLNFGEGDTLLLAGFGAGKFEAASGLAVTLEGAVTIQSWAGLVNLAQDGSAVVRRLGQTTALEIIVANETGQQQALFVKDGWAAYNQAQIDDTALTSGRSGFAMDSESFEDLMLVHGRFPDTDLSSTGFLV